MESTRLKKDYATNQVLQHTPQKLYNRHSKILKQSSNINNFNKSRMQSALTQQSKQSIDKQLYTPSQMYMNGVLDQKRKPQFSQNNFTSLSALIPANNTPESNVQLTHLNGNSNILQQNNIKNNSNFPSRDNRKNFQPPSRSKIVMKQSKIDRYTQST